MYNQDLEENIIKKQSRDILKGIFTIGVLLISAFIIKIFVINNEKDYIISSVTFVRQVNGLIAVIAIISCLILYKKTKDSIVFTLLLVYVGLAISSITGQFDYYTFLNYSFRVSNYSSILSSFLRIVILFITIKPNSKLHKIINKYKVKSFIFVVIYSIVGWELEKRTFAGEFFSNRAIFLMYNLFVFATYTIVALRLLLICIRENKIIIGTFSVSLFLFAIKAVYIIYGYKHNSLSMKLTCLSVIKILMYHL